MTTIIRKLRTTMEWVAIIAAHIVVYFGMMAAFALAWVLIACVLSGIAHLISAGSPIVD